ncbi:MAG: hypothetical protein K2H38_05995 [Muribaculaceae bacterium]|nr:hypothetical protein [Muribaculaceae bacterium]
MNLSTDSIESGESLQNNEGLHSDFISYLNGRDPETLSEMLSSRVIPSLLLSMRRHGITDFSEAALRLWTVDMLLDGLKGSTVKRYTGALHTLYKEWRSSLGPEEDKDTVFTVSLAGIDTDASAKRLKETEENLEAVERFTRMSLKQDSPAFLYGKAFQFLLFDPFASLKDIVSLKFSDKLPDSLHLEDIVTSMRNAPQAKYVFPLQQGKRREPAIVKDLLSELHATGRRAGLKFAESFSRESITALWVAAAIREDIPYGEIRGVLTTLPGAYACLSLIPPVEVSESRKSEIMNMVAFSITNKNPGWFVLRLRSGVTPEKIKERLKEKESPLQRQIQYYYPMRTIKKIEKKKVVSTEVPVIPGLLFFRLPYDRVAPLIGLIGDLAWCYRTSNTPSSPYSVIPQGEMRIFQRCVGAFTEDVEMDIVSELPPLNIGDEVMIEDGSMLNGQVATIRKVRNVDGTLTYTLRLSDTEFIKWHDVSLPASHLTKI